MCLKRPGSSLSAEIAICSRSGPSPATTSTESSSAETARIPSSTRLLSISALTIRIMGRSAGSPNFSLAAAPGLNFSRSTPLGMSEQFQLFSLRAR